MTTKVQSVTRAFDLLEGIETLGGAASISELAEIVPLPLPTIHRLLNTLATTSFLIRLADRKYALSPRLVQLGQAALSPIGKNVQPLIEEAATELKESVSFAILQRNFVVYLASESPDVHTMRTFVETGRNFHCHNTGVGKAILASISEARAMDIVGAVGLPRRTPNTITSVADLSAELANVRQRGYAVDDHEQEIGVRCFAVALPTSTIPAAVSVSGPSVRVTDRYMEANVDRVKELGLRLARASQL